MRKLIMFTIAFCLFSSILVAQLHPDLPPDRFKPSQPLRFVATLDIVGMTSHRAVGGSQGSVMTTTIGRRMAKEILASYVTMEFPEPLSPVHEVYKNVALSESRYPSTFKLVGCADAMVRLYSYEDKLRIKPKYKGKLRLRTVVSVYVQHARYIIEAAISSNGFTYKGERVGQLKILD